MLYLYFAVFKHSHGGAHHCEIDLYAFLCVEEGAEDWHVLSSITAESGECANHYSVLYISLKS